MEAALTTTVLGKRKARGHVGIIHLASSPEPTASEQSDFELVLSKPILVNGKLAQNTKRPYHCTHPGCDKAYTKPSRLGEHQRTHTGERPFSCETCQKSYLRETHLQAHVRTHLPESSRPLLCDFEGCSKRFWTSQHLRVHQDWHNGATPFTCTEAGCHGAFSKHHQLRSHICEAHTVPGTKPYRCDHEGCTKSFDTNQHLRTHKKTHNAKRYTCVHGSCLVQSAEQLKFFSTWSLLQHHIRSEHPPTCQLPSCEGRVFASQKGLRSHQKIHEQRDAEEQLLKTISSEDDGDDRPAKKPRRGGDLGRDWKCDIEDCDKDFKSKKALTTHKNVTHLGKRDFTCSQCLKSFGYKHLLQRHAAKIHAQPSEQSDSAGHTEDNNDSESDSEPFNRDHIDKITGKAYADRTSANIARATAFRCPFPELGGLEHTNISLQDLAGPSAPPRCEYGFTRLYDLRRHLHANHQVEASRECLQNWMKQN